MMDKSNSTFGTFAWRITTAHTIAYFIAGMFAVLVMKYDELFGVGALSFMRPTDSSWVATGPGLQVLRGLLLSFVLYPFRSVFLETDYGWLKFWTLSFGLSYLLTFAAAIGSFEGLIYTNFPLKFHLLGLPEALIYTTLFTVFLWGWYRKPVRLFNAASAILTLLIVLMSVMGVLASLGMVKPD